MPDTTAPVISNISPADNETDVAIDTNIVFDITDPGSGVDQSQLNVTFEGRPAVTSGTINSSVLGQAEEGFGGSISAISDGYRVTLNPNFTLFHDRVYTWSVDGYDGNEDPNQILATYTFTTGTGTRVLKTALNQPYNHSIKLFFSDDMQNDSRLADVNNYKIAGDAYVSAVDIDTDSLDQVVLTAEKLYAETEFDIVIYGVRDGYGRAINPNHRTATVTIDEPTGIDISGFSGSLRTANNINTTFGDATNWYFGTSGGLDVVNKSTRLNTGYITDAYGVTNITVDSDTIYYTNQNPHDAYGVFSLPVSVVNGDSADGVVGLHDQLELPSLSINELSTDGNDILVIASDSGCFVSRDGYALTYSSGKEVVSAAMDENGQHLYLVNATDNQLDVYYNAGSDISGRSVPDFTYSNVSNPAIAIDDESVVKIMTGASTANEGSNTLYISSADGVSRVDADESNPGSSESSGTSVQYGVVGSGFDHEVLGGESNRVINVDLNTQQLQLYVLTDDISSADLDDGFSIINLSSNALFGFTATEDLPSNISSIFFWDLLDN